MSRVTWEAHRDYHDPEELIRYIDGQTVFAINAKGLVALLVPVTDQRSGEGRSEIQLDVSALVRSIVPLIVAVANGGFDKLYPGHLSSRRLDWRISVSRYVNSPSGVTVPWSGLTFAGRPPDQSTPGQLPPLAGGQGFGGPDLWNIPMDTAPAEIIMKALQSLISRSGYSGLDGCLADVRTEVDLAVANQRHQ